MGPAISESSCLLGLKRLGVFAITITLLSGLISGAVFLLQLWPEFSWWKIFRRCVSLAAACALIVIARRDPQSSSFRALGLGDFRKGRGQVGVGVAIAFGMVAAILIGYSIVGVSRIKIDPDTSRMTQILITFLPLAGLISVLEELVFRGFILQQLMRCSRLAAALLSSLAYALVHLRERVAWPGTVLELGGLFLFGIVLTLSYFRTKQLYLSIGLHTGLAYYARVSKLFVEMTVPSLQWLVGTSRLVNGLVAWLAFIVLGIGLAWWPPRIGTKDM